MTTSRGEGTLVRYYCTAGNGMEHFLMEELKRKLAAENVRHIPGKVLFSSSAEISRVCELKAAERLFLLLKHDSPVSLTAHTSPAKAISVLQSRLLGDKNQWTGTLMTWSRLQRELAHKRMTVNTSTTAVGLRTKGEDGRRSEEEEKCSVASGKCTGGQAEGNGRQRSVTQNGAQTLEKKRKRDDEDDEEERRATALKHSSEKNVEKERTSEGEEERGMTKDVAVESAENVTTTGGRDATLLHPSSIKPEPSPVPVTFRISCKCTGSLSRYFNTREVSKVVGVGLSRLLGWKIDLRNPQLEINVYLSDDHCLLGIPITRFLTEGLSLHVAFIAGDCMTSSRMRNRVSLSDKHSEGMALLSLFRLPLANRCYIQTTGLRSTVAWAMASLAQIQPGFSVVDPMCGVGTILIEAAQEHKAAHFLGMDIDDGQLQKAQDNIEFAELGNRIHLLKASSMMLPLPSASVDAVVCDLPFGRKFDTKTNMAANLRLILTEMERVLCVGGALVLLLSPQLSCLLKKLLAQRDTETSTNQETKPGTQHYPSPSSSPTRHQGSNSPPTQKTGPQSGLQHSLPPLPLSLKHQVTLRVSLGLIDGLIHRYVKMKM